MKRSISAMVAFVAVAPSAAFAHAHLVKAKPAAGSTVSTPPSVVAIEFSESVVPRLSAIAISDAAGKPVKAAKPAGSGASLSAAVQGKLSPGTYTVTWHAVSVDTHRTQGRFTFTVAP